MKVALYLRVSTLDQNSDMQRRELEAYAKRHEWEVSEVYEDCASGADTSRPALARLLAECAAGRVKCVLCWKLDRFGRSLADCLRTLEILDRRRVRFLAVSQGIDTDRANPASRFSLQVLAAAAEFERELIRERSTSGLIRYRQDLAAGRVGKTVHSRSGKDLAPHRPRRILSLTKIQRLRGEGRTVPAIARIVGASTATIKRRLSAARAEVAEILRPLEPPSPGPEPRQEPPAGSGRP